MTRVVIDLLLIVITKDVLEYINFITAKLNDITTVTTIDTFAKSTDFDYVGTTLVNS